MKPARTNTGNQDLDLASKRNNIWGHLRNSQALGMVRTRFRKTSARRSLSVSLITSRQQKNGTRESFKPGCRAISITAFIGTYPAEATLMSLRLTAPGQVWHKNRFVTGLGKTDVSNIALLNQIADRADGIFDRHRCILAHLI